MLPTAARTVMADTRSRILKAAVARARVDGVQWITRDAVAAEAQVSAGLVNYYWGAMVELKRDVFKEAVRQEILPLIAQGLADGNAACRQAPKELKRKALGSVM